MNFHPEHRRRARLHPRQTCSCSPGLLITFSPRPHEHAVFAELDQQLQSWLASWSDVLSKDVPALNDAMRKSNIPLIAPAPTAGR